MALGGGTIVRTAWARARLFSQLPLPAPCLKYAAQAHSVVLQRSLLSSSPCLSHPASGASAPGHFTHTQPPVGLSRWRHQQARVSIHHDILGPGLWRGGAALEGAAWVPCRMGSLGASRRFASTDTESQQGQGNPEVEPTTKKKKKKGRFRNAVDNARPMAKKARDAVEDAARRAPDAARAAVETAKEVPQNIKDLLRLYGRTALLVYACMDVVTLSLSFCAVKYGVDVAAVLDAVGLPALVGSDGETNGFMASFIIALGLNKITIPFRVGATAAVVPTVARRLRISFPEASKKWLGL
eukprot:m.38546 g.38546  ORF g.38546 m.38546 type:complete len:298 (-) comp5672_c0_seq2:196-1089(-)